MKLLLSISLLFALQVKAEGDPNDKPQEGAAVTFPGYACDICEKHTDSSLRLGSYPVGKGAASPGARQKSTVTDAPSGTGNQNQ